MVGKAGQHVAEEAMQLFEGMYTGKAASVSHYGKRIVMIAPY